MTTKSAKPKRRLKGLIPVLFAIGGNFLVACAKLVGYFISNSSSLFSEAVHSFADTVNQALLLLGIALSQKKANKHKNDK